MGQEKSFKIENGLFVKQNSEFLEDVQILGNLTVGGSVNLIPSTSAVYTLFDHSNHDDIVALILNDEVVLSASPVYKNIEESMTISLSDEDTAITTGTEKITFRAPFAMTLTSIPRSSLSTASSSGLVTVDINKGGTSVLGTDKLSIDADEKTSTTAATATTISTTSVEDDSELTFDIDAAGTGAKGLKVTLYYKRS